MNKQEYNQYFLLEAKFQTLVEHYIGHMYATRKKIWPLNTPVRNIKIVHRDTEKITVAIKGNDGGYNAIDEFQVRYSDLYDFLCNEQSSGAE